MDREFLCDKAHMTATLLRVTIRGTLCTIRAIVVPIHKGGDRSLITNYRPVSLTSVVCKQMEHIIASYLRQVWDKNKWLYEGQHGFRPGYSCESQVITVCQDIADTMDNGDRIDAIVIDFSKAFDFVLHDQLLIKIVISGMDSRIVAWVREFLRSRTQSQSRRAIIRGSLSNIWCTARERIRSSSISSLH